MLRFEPKVLDAAISLLWNPLVIEVPDGAERPAFLEHGARRVWRRPTCPIGGRALVQEVVGRAEGCQSAGLGSLAGMVAQADRSR